VPRLRYFGRLLLVIFAVALLVNALASGIVDGLPEDLRILPR
jgi:Mn2+/Fe2+ NRAMP family transporter